MKKLSKLIVFFVLIPLIFGCSAKKPKDNTIIVWHWMTDRKDAFSELATKYQAETGVNVEFKLLFPPETYSMKVTAAARAKTLPDIFGILGEKTTVGSFIRAQHIADLTPYMNENFQEWKNRFYPQTLDLVVFKDGNSSQVKPGIYAVPIDTTIMQFVYNKSLLDKLGFSAPPETFEEFIKYAALVKGKSDQFGFVCGWGEGWLLNALAIEWAINLMGEEKFLQTIERKVSYTDPDWLKVFTLFETLKNSGILVPNIATMTNKESEDAFAKGKALFSFNGSWSINVYQQLNPEIQYGFFSLPKISIEHPVKIWGGSGSSFMVNERSPNKLEAIKFLKWFTAKQQQVFLIEKTNNLPAIKDCQDQMPEKLRKLTLNLSNLTHPDTWPDNEDSRVIEVINRGLQQIVMGLKTPSEVAREVQEKKDKIFRK
ncbi:MAG: extracellular solute-binding protein [Candidatus Omnitrophica bacterium]|nr:extracellular solute-binding protein [Candidatus Omnitrophota bacterium]MBU2044450.1 extracellular solute-binding protein [Candidatus Omnitrophota bacterium]MBU2251351.1 extracellular solute-binding protein [Candidatus Omnitrophota bacterium]MBU2265576.1 extracellular solute-binding protein [Candidatus Omnitrophota bacterium]MBU2474080.1 extracellular solute-binding protein [Candidatus Omnitrophota bacterium]